MANKDTSKQWFETGDYPTQAQFAQVFEWLRWKDEQLAIADVIGLVGVINSFTDPIVTKESFVIDGTLQKLYTIPAGYLLTHFVVLPSAGCTPACSYEPVPTGAFVTVDGIDPVTVAEGFVWFGNLLAIAARQVLVASVPVGTTVIFIKTKIV